MTQAEAARVFGVHRNAVNRWIRRYREGGWDGLGEQRRGRRPGEQPALSERQQQELIALVRESIPDQLGLAGFLWTRDAVAELLAQRYGVWLARTTVGGYLRGWGFSPQRPQRRALEQNPVAVARWLAPSSRPSVPRPAGREGWCCGWMRWCCGWMRWGSARMRRRAAPGRRWARPRSSREPASASGST